MRRFPLIPFLLSAAVSASLLVSLWQRRETERVRKPAVTKVRTETPDAGGESRAGGEPTLTFEAFCQRSETVDVLFLDSLDKRTVESMVKSAPALEEGDPRHRCFLALLYRWTEMDVNAALEWSLSLPPGKARKRALESVLGPLAESDPAGMVRWFNKRTGHRPREISNGDSALQEQWGEVAGILGGKDNRSLDEILTDFRALPDGTGADAISRLTKEWDASLQEGNHWRQAQEQLGALASGAAGPLADWAENRMYELARQALATDPYGVMGSLEKWEKKGQRDMLTEEALGGLLMYSRSGAAKREPGEAGNAPGPSEEEIAQWFLRIPRLSTDRSALGILIDMWAREDVNAAGAFLNRLPASPDADAARAAMALRAVEVDPEAAFRWADAVSGEPLRLRTQKELLEKWRKIDPAGATAWVAGRQAEREQ